MMAKMKMKDLKKMIKEKREKSSNINYGGDFYPFWNMKPGEIARIRFLPDESGSPFPFAEKLEHKISVNGNMRKVPWLQRFGKKCPICDLSKQYYDAEGKGSQNGKYYYRNKAHLAKALVLEDPLPKDSDTGENFVGKVVTVQLGFQIMEKIMEQLTTFFDDDDELPWHLTKGFDFIIKKVMQGDYEKYDIGSTFAKKPSPIPDEFVENIELIDDVETLLPDEPTLDEVNALLDSHLSGEDLDSDSLESKKKNTSTSSGDDSPRKNALQRLMGEDDEDDSDDDDDDLTEDTSSDDDSDDDGDDDDDDDLRALIDRIKSNKE